MKKYLDYWQVKVRWRIWQYVYIFEWRVGGRSSENFILTRKDEDKLCEIIQLNPLRIKCACSGGEVTTFMQVGALQIYY